MTAPGDVFQSLVRAHRRRWTHTDELLALILTKLDELVITTALAWSDPKKAGGLKNARPYQYPRPMPRPKERPSTIEEIAAFVLRSRK